MSTPKRIQRKRTKGWRMPEGAVYVGRPSRWGNCFSLSGDEPHVDIVGPDGWFTPWYFPTRRAATEHAVKAFRWHLENRPNVTGFAAEDVRRELAGRDLACWCPLDQPCHADVLLEIANGATS